MIRSRMLLYLLWMIALTAGLYPLVWLLCCWADNGAWVSIALSAVLPLCALLGTAQILLLRKQISHRPRLVNGSFWLGCLLLVMAACWLLPFSVMLLRGAYGVIAAACYFGTSRLAALPLERTAHPYVLFGFGLGYLLVGAVLYCSGNSVPVSGMVVLLVILTLLFSEIRNHHAMEQLMIGRDDQTWELPREVRRSNRHLMEILWGVVLLVLVCFRPFTYLLRRLWALVSSGLIMLLQWLFSGESSGAGTEQASQESTEQATSLPGNSNSWVQYVVWILLAGALFFFLIRFRREIWEGICSWFRRMHQWISRRLKNVAAPQWEADRAYCDYIEDLQQEEQISSSVSSASRRQWRQKYRCYRHMAPGIARYRLGYALLLNRLPAELTKPPFSPDEILIRVKAAYPEQEALLSNWKIITDGYLRVRYGEMEPDSAASEAMDALLQHM